MIEVVIRKMIYGYKGEIRGIFFRKTKLIALPPIGAKIALPNVADIVVKDLVLSPYNDEFNVIIGIKSFLNKNEDNGEHLQELIKILESEGWER